MKRFNELLWLLYTMVWLSPLIVLPVFVVFIGMRMARLGVTLRQVTPTYEIGGLLVGVGLIVSFLSALPSYRRRLKSEEEAAITSSQRYNKVLIAGMSIAVLGGCLMIAGR